MRLPHTETHTQRHTDRDTHAHIHTQTHTQPLPLSLLSSIFVVVDLCNPNPCQQGVPCRSTEGGYVCACPEGYYGNERASTTRGSLSPSSET
uniref:EGF-like domain-containing protein n=1 Tax=Hucho hucho TaxID=62062 RepID=A0A4W5JY16_9TELE